MAHGTRDAPRSSPPQHPSLADEPSGAWLASSQRLQVWAYLPAVVIPLLGDLLADRLDVTAVRSVATPAEEELSRTGPYIADKLGPVTAILKMMPDWIPLAKEAGKMMAEHSKRLATEAALERSLNPDMAAQNSSAGAGNQGAGHHEQASEVWRGRQEEQALKR